MSLLLSIAEANYRKNLFRQKLLPLRCRIFSVGVYVDNIAYIDEKCQKIDFLLSYFKQAVELDKKIRICYYIVLC